MREYHSRKSTRIPDYDYSASNYYFVTICTQEKKCIFGKPDQLNWRGMIARQDMEELVTHYRGITVDCYVVMPNHIHAIIVINDSHGKIRLDQLVGLYKSGVTRKIKEKEPDSMVWQRSFHDHIIRNQSSYEKIWNYVTYNAMKWEEDCFYTKMSDE